MNDHVGPAVPGEEPPNGTRWDQARAQLAGLPAGGLNVAHEAVDRHVLDGHGDRIAIRWLGTHGRRREVTYTELAEASARWANALDALGVEPGSTVFTLLGRVPELFAVVLGTLKHRSVVSTLYPVFGPEPVRHRLALGHGVVLVTSARLYERRVASVRDQLPELRHVVVVGGEGDEPAPDGTRSYGELVAASSPRFTIPATDPEDRSFLHFTSGTTGTPKGAVHVHGGVVAVHATAVDALDLRPGTVYWCTADPGWVTGVAYGIVAPLLHGCTCVVDEGDFDSTRWLEILERERVEVWYTAPTALRRLVHATGVDPDAHDLSSLRLAASVGEPLGADLVEWGRRHLGVPVRDTWWQTETGAIMVADHPGIEVRPGAMGRPLPGVVAALAERDPHGDLLVDDTGEPVLVTEPDRIGELVLRTGWPSLFRGYLEDPERSARCIVGGWYRTGDLVRRDADGYLWFAGRADDVITSAGHLVGPVEVERVLDAHPHVLRSGVIGLPDPIAGERVTAIVTLVPGVAPSDELRLELIADARRALGPAVAPRDVRFADDLPLTPSGKIMRRVLRERERGEDP
jgi:acetyl-CoA synthetase